jgi:DHA2 family multidrug resistance protein
MAVSTYQSAATAAVETPEIHSHKWLVAAAVMVGAFLQVLDSTVVNVALPHMQGSFAASVDEITWVVTSYLVATSVMVPLTGWLAARFGRKRYFLISIAMFVGASALCGVAQRLDQMVVFRLIQGASGAAMMPLSQAILLETFPPAEHTLAMSTFGLGMMVAPMMGPTLGGWITMNWSWRWNFYINVPAGAIAALLVFLFVHDPPYLRERRGRGRIDYLGIIYVALALGMLQIVLDRGQRADWFAATWVRAFTLGSALSMVLLVSHELRFPDPIIDFRMLGIASFAVGILLISLQAVLSFSVNLMNPLFMQEQLGYDAWKAGLVVAPRGIGVVVALITVGQLARRGVDVRPLVTFGAALAGYAIWSMSDWNLQVSMTSVLWPITLLGLGLGSFFPTVTAAGLNEVPPERMGFATSLFAMMTNAGAAIGVASVSNILTSREQTHQAYLVQHFSVFDEWKMSRMAPRMPGQPPSDFVHLPMMAQRRHLGAVYATIQAQAWLLAYNDVYRLLAILAFAIVPWCPFLRRTHGRTDLVTE